MVLTSAQRAALRAKKAIAEGNHNFKPRGSKNKAAFEELNDKSASIPASICTGPIQTVNEGEGATSPAPPKAGDKINVSQPLRKDKRCRIEQYSLEELEAAHARGEIWSASPMTKQCFNLFELAAAQERTRANQSLPRVLGEQYGCSTLCMSTHEGDKPTTKITFSTMVAIDGAIDDDDEAVDCRFPKSG